MPTWDFSPASLLFPLAVAAVWGIIFLLVVYISRYAAHEHDSEAQAEAQEEELIPAAPATGGSAGPMMTPLPS